MGLFHKTLKDVEKEYNKGNHTKALKIIEQHINAEHSVRGTYSALNEIFAKFSTKFELMEGTLKDIVRGNGSEITHKDFKNALIGSQRLSMELIHYAEEFLEKCKEEK